MDSRSPGVGHIAVRSDEEVGLIRFPTGPGVPPPVPPSTEEEACAHGSWTRYEVRAGTQRGPLAGLRSLVLSEEAAFRPGVVNETYERWVDDVWGPGVTSLPDYIAHFLMRGVSGTRRGKYAAIGWFPNAAAREQLLVALGDLDNLPTELLEYRRLIDHVFSTYLDRNRRRFTRLDVVPASEAGSPAQP